MNLSKSNYQAHFYFIFLIAIHYLISIIFVGQIIVEPNDNLDVTVVYDHIISKIYKGNFESLSYFLSGEIKWYYLEKLLYPTNILHYLLNDKLFYYTTDILEKLFSYFSFYLLAKSLNISKFNSALGAILYSTLVYLKLPMGLGLAFLPYILYLLLNKDSLKKKHYFILFLIGLNSSLIQDIFSFIFLIPLSFLLKSKSKNLDVYLKIFSVILISSILSNIHLVIGSILTDPIHREFFNIRVDDFAQTFLNVLWNFLAYTSFGNDLFIFFTPLLCLSVFLLVSSLFSKQKKIRLLFLFIIFIFILKLIFSFDFIDNIFVGFLGILKGYNFARLDRIIPITFTLLLVLYITNLKNKNLKNFLYFISIFSVLSIQLSTPLSVIGQHFLKENMHVEEFDKTKKNFLEKKYIRFLNTIFDKKNYTKSGGDSYSLISKTFDNYYKFNDYAYIRNIVKDSRVLSVGLDPMVAVMNDIRVIDGYHTIYPFSYKIKFRKIIEKELEKNIIFKNYFDNWGNRVYAFYNDENDILLNFKAAKKLNANYVISGFPIKNNELEIICSMCNNSNKIFLYKIL